MEPLRGATPLSLFSLRVGVRNGYLIALGCRRSLCSSRVAGSRETKSSTRSARELSAAAAATRSISSRQHSLAERFPAMAKRKAVERIQWHRRQGHLLLLATGSLDLYAVAIGDLLGFHQVVATRAAWVDDRIAGGFEGGNLRGEAKLAGVRRALSLVRPTAVAHHRLFRPPQRFAALAFCRRRDCRRSDAQASTERRNRRAQRRRRQLPASISTGSLRSRSSHTSNIIEQVRSTRSW